MPCLPISGTLFRNFNRASTFPVPRQGLNLKKAILMSSTPVPTILERIQKLESLARRTEWRSVDRDLMLDQIRDLYDHVLEYKETRPLPPSPVPPAPVPSSAAPSAEPGADPLVKEPGPSPSLRPKPTQVYEPGAAALAHPRSSRDIRRLISLNEQFGFVQELFSGNGQRYNQVLDALNGMESFEQAVSWLEDQVHDPERWKDQDPQVENFYEIIRKQFDSQTP